MSKKRVVLQCDCHFIRAGVEGVIKKSTLSKHIEIIANTDEITRCAELMFIMHNIDIVILTLSHRNYEPWFLLKFISNLLPRVQPGSQVLILNNRLNIESLKNYLRKLKNVHEIMDISLSLDELHKQLLSLSQNMSNSDLQTSQSSSPLSLRELEVLNRLLKGDATIQIAEDLRINYKTVSCHKRSALKKIGIRSLNPLLSRH
ncbi:MULTISPECIES: LuxR C-terminal-related transcriptional regulator [unclassified Serratia (in: enterobacteria)]|uniref:helix-turn-helix transcriptional regulator n=1 Tax=unclassified Serratia (in: enterobacteria) TaxID=2647522 RepID=UPI00050665B1|nr:MULTISPECIES: LuxR C-terminal-related transcriptional regulator [unclassified Serratia (in: enterobacteria)]KFK94638.1 hypothetical protein JV45_12055 [Serratia sp. Ag2]KFK95858.1 hypothetical protein IV04_20825 [Serratia sp. Ag1]